MLAQPGQMRAGAMRLPAGCLRQVDKGRARLTRQQLHNELGLARLLGCGVGTVGACGACRIIGHCIGLSWFKPEGPALPLTQGRKIGRTCSAAQGNPPAATAHMLDLSPKSSRITWVGHIDIELLIYCAQKLVVDFKAQARLGGPMDTDTRDLIIRLCTEAATRMEDASVAALRIQSASEQDVQEVLN